MGTWRVYRESGAGWPDATAPVTLAGRARAGQAGER